MLLNRQGFPQVEELVMCTITGIQLHSVFCTLDEYGGRTGMIHISEVATGRIRNIRDFVQQGKKVICRVINISEEKGYIDLSLRRVNETQRRQKVNEIKREQLAEKIIEQYSRSAKLDVLKVYSDISGDVLKKYPLVSSCFELVAKGEESLESLGIDKQAASSLVVLIKQRMTPEEVIIEGDFVLTSYASNGVELIKEALAQPGADIVYRGASKYHLVVKGDDYKRAEKVLKSIVDIVLSIAKSKKISAEWQRLEE